MIRTIVERPRDQHASGAIHRDGVDGVLVERRGEFGIKVEGFVNAALKVEPGNGRFKGATGLKSSGGGDRNEMIDFVRNQKRLKKIFLVHGEYDTQVAFRSLLDTYLHVPVEIPTLAQEFIID